MIYVFKYSIMVCQTAAGTETPSEFAIAEICIFAAKQDSDLYLQFTATPDSNPYYTQQQLEATVSSCS